MNIFKRRNACASTRKTTQVIFATTNIFEIKGPLGYGYLFFASQAAAATSAAPAWRCASPVGRS